jgi:acetolactate synthase-1/2/3 large subunit
MSYFSDKVIDFLIVNNFDYVSFNPGASFRGIHDSLVEKGVPQIVMCCHEEISVAIAHGYYKASGRHIAVIVHANIGLQHASMAVFNAWCDRVPLFVIGGNGPNDAMKRRPWIDWIHTSQGVDTIIKEFVKWCDQPTGQGATLESLSRALRLSRTAPCAPVYVAIDSTIQEEVCDEWLTGALGVPQTSLPPISYQAIDMVLNELLHAENPLFIVGYSGKSAASVAHLVHLSETLGAAVLDEGNRYNFPNVHPMCFVERSPILLENADVIVAIDVQDIWGAVCADEENRLRYSLPSNRKIITISDQELLVSKWAADYQRLLYESVPLIGDSEVTLRVLDEKAFEAIDRTDQFWLTSRDNRVKRITSEHNKQLDYWIKEVDALRDKSPIHVSVAVSEIYAAVRSEDWVLTNTGSVTIDNWVRRLWKIEREGCYIGQSGGAGLGYGLGASIGAALANIDNNKISLNLQADGDMLYTPSALWTLTQYRIPLLIIVMNNRLYLNSKQHAEQIASLRSRDISSAIIATSFYENPVDFIAIAKAFNVKTVGSVTKVEEIQPKVREALDYLKKSRLPVLIEIIMA